MATGGILYVIDEQVFGEKYFLLVDEKGKLSIPKGYPWQVDEIYDPRKLAARRSLDTVALVIDGKLFSPPVGPREIASVDLFHCDDYMKETAGRLGLDKYICDQLDTAEYALNKDFVQITAEGHYAVAFHGNVTWDVEKSTLGFVRGIYVPFVRLNRLKTYDKQERNHVLVPVLGNENYCTVLQTGRRVHREEFTIDPLDRDLLHRLTPRERG